MPPTAADHPHQVESLYRHHRGWLHGWLNNQLGCTHQAADVVQDTFVRLLLRDMPLSNAAPRALLKTIAKGLVIDHWRRSAIEKAYLEALATLPAAHSPSPEQKLEALQTLQRVDALLEGLSQQVRNAFLLYRLGGLPQQEIARQMGVTPRSIERYVATAMLHCYRLRFGED